MATASIFERESFTTNRSGERGLVNFGAKVGAEAGALLAKTAGMSLFTTKWENLRSLDSADIAALVLTGSTVMEVLGLGAIAASIFHGDTAGFLSGAGLYSTGRLASLGMEKIGKDVGEKATRHALTDERWDDWMKWFAGFSEYDWFPKFPGAAAYYEKYHPQNFSAEFRMDKEGEGRKTLYIRDGYNSVAADDCYYRTTQVERLKQEKLIDEKAKTGRVWTIYATNIDYLGWEDKGEKKMVDLIKTTTDAIDTVYQGELIYAFAGTNDKKLQVILEKAGFVRRGETPEWSDDLDKKALYVLDLRDKTYAR